MTGRFYVFRELTKYTVFLSTTSPAIAYGVLALSQPFEELIGPYLPVLTQTVLLPFKGVIVYDGLMTSYNVSFGPGIRRNLAEDFKTAKDRHGIVTSLPVSATPLPVKSPKAKPAPKPPLRETKDESLAVIVGLIDQFCREHLNEEYAGLCRKLAEKLARKRPSPLASGKPQTWACGIVRTIGWVNYLDDRSQDAAHEADGHRQGVRRRGKHRPGQVDADPQDAEDQADGPGVVAPQPGSSGTRRPG